EGQAGQHDAHRPDDFRRYHEIEVRARGEARHEPHHPAGTRTTAAAHWPWSVWATFSAYGRVVGRASQVTWTGQSGSLSVWLSVADSDPSRSASTLAASSSTLAPLPTLPK